MLTQPKTTMDGIFNENRIIFVRSTAFGQIDDTVSGMSDNQKSK